MGLMGFGAAWDLGRAIAGASRRATRDRYATVTRRDPDGVTWGTIAGASGEVPLGGSLADAEVGDVVAVDWRGGVPVASGNATSPSVGARRVEGAVAPVRAASAAAQGAARAAQSVADAAKSVAEAVNQHFFADTSGIHVTAATQDEWETSHSGANVLLNSAGQLFRDGLNNLLTLTTEGGARALTVWDGLGNAAGNVRAVIGEVITLGNAADGSVVTIDSDSLDMVHGTTEMLHFGYGEGTTATGGTADAPYYTLGVRTTGSSVGNYSVAEGESVVASGACSHAEGYGTTASGGYSHAEGIRTTASRTEAHAEGYETVASGVSSHAQNEGTIASGFYQTAMGRYNVSNPNYALIIGNGEQNIITQAITRRNAMTVDWDGSVVTRSETYAGNESVSSNTAIHKIDSYDKDNQSIGYTQIVRTSSGIYRSFAVRNIDTSKAAAIYVNNYDDGSTTLSGSSGLTLARDATTVTLSNSSATTNQCWKNMALATVTLGALHLTSALSSGSNRTVGTVPSGYRPVGDVTAVCGTNGDASTGKVFVIIGSSGTITLYNRTGASLGTGVNMYLTATYAI